MAGLRERLVAWRRRRDRRLASFRRELDDEISLHLELRAEKLMGTGLDETSARFEARRKFGALGPAKRTLYRAARRRERVMDVQGMVDGMRQDAAYAVRMLVRQPAVSLVIVVTMALGLGANAAMFGVIDRLMLRGPTHVIAPEELVRLTRTVSRGGLGEVTSGTMGYVSYTAMRDGTRSFAGVAAHRVVDGLLGGGAEAARIRVGSATHDFFDLLGVPPQLGRFYGEAEDRPGQGARVVVLGDALWRSRFGGDAGVIGRTVEVDGRDVAVIGVAPRAFTGIDLQRVDVWLPMTLISPGFRSDWETTWNAQWLSLVGRLQPGATVAQAESDATSAHRRVAADGPETQAEARIGLSPLTHDRHGGEPLELAVSRWLLGVSVIVLLVACANVTALLLARGARRRREVAVRLALGVSRHRLIRLLLIEGVLLALIGALGALVLSHVAGTLMRTLLLPDVEWVTSPVNGRVLLFTVVVAVAAGVLTALVPALRSSRSDLTSAMRTGRREGGGRTSVLQRGLTVLQAALSVILLVGAGLFVRSLLNVQGLDLGIEPARAMAVDVYQPALPPVAEAEARLAERRRREVWMEQALEALRGHSDVERAAMAVGTPFHSSFSVDLRASGHDSIPAMEGGGPYVAAVSSDYFETVGTSVLQGRAFTSADRRGSEPVAIVNRTMATTLWPDRAALGECLYVGRPGAPCSRVVGVVEDARRFGIREPAAMQYYVPTGHEVGFSGSMLLVRPRAAATLSADDIRSLLYGMDAGLRWVDVGTLQEELDPQIRPWRLGAALFAAFGGLALLIAGIGLYSVIAYAVTNRAHELCVRLALGAQASNLLRMVLRQGATLAVIGVAAGLLVAFVASRYLEAVLFEASPRDPLVFGAVAATLLLTAFLASLIPALRAAAVDPATSLRNE